MMALEYVFLFVAVACFLISFYRLGCKNGIEIALHRLKPLPRSATPGPPTETSAASWPPPKPTAPPLGDAKEGEQPPCPPAPSATASSRAAER